jgi:F-box protein 18 (helicase)
MNDSNTSPKHNILHFTEEQSTIINSNGDLAINAVAGSGKTTTIIEYAASRPASSRILYLAFNKSVKLEAVRKFAERGLTNVTVETAHSLD